MKDPMYLSTEAQHSWSENSDLHGDVSYFLETSGRFEATHFNQTWTFSFLVNGSADIFGQLAFWKS